MAKKKFSQLTPADDLDGSEIVAIVQDGQSRQSTTNAVSALSNGNLFHQDTSPGIILLDFQNRSDVVVVGMSPITSSRTLGLDNAGNGKRFKFIFEITDTGAYMDLPSNWLYDSSDTRFTSSPRRWTSDFATGVFQLTAVFEGSNWLIDISKANYI